MNVKRCDPRVALALLAALGAAPPAWGGERTATSAGVGAVVELFTSQGCASCPPAGEVFARMADDPGIVALAYHVDYWDYIGWQDVNGSRENTERQRAYAKSLGLGTIYTPQVVVNGQRDVIGSRADKIRAVLDADRLETGAPKAAITLSVDGKRLRVNASALPEATRGRTTVLMLVTFAEETRTTVERGENKGLRLIDRHAVRDWRVLGMLAGKPMETEIPLAALQPEPGLRIGCAAILQTVTETGEPGPILAAASIEL